MLPSQHDINEANRSILSHPEFYTHRNWAPHMRSTASKPRLKPRLPSMRMNCKDVDLMPYLCGASASVLAVYRKAHWTFGMVHRRKALRFSQSPTPYDDLRIAHVLLCVAL